MLSPAFKEDRRQLQKLISRALNNSDLIQEHTQDESILMAPRVMTISELQKAIQSGEKFLEAIHMAEVEAEASIMRKLLTQDVKPYEAYLLGRMMHLNLINIMEEELQRKHSEKPKAVTK